MKRLIIAFSALILTGCHTLREPPPGNELAELIMHKDFFGVAKDYPEFATRMINTVTRLEHEQAWANYRKMEAIKATQKRIAKPAPPQPPKP